MHRIEGFQIRPGATVKVRQHHPCFVVECEGANIAMDTEIAFNIRVWLTENQFKNLEVSTLGKEAKGSGGLARLLKFGRGRRVVQPLGPRGGKTE